MDKTLTIEKLEKMTLEFSQNLERSPMKIKLKLPEMNTHHCLTGILNKRTAQGNFRKDIFTSQGAYKRSSTHYGENIIKKFRSKVEVRQVIIFFK